MRKDFPNRYGHWALVAGGSVGLGAAYARALAARGMNLVLVARRERIVGSLAEECRDRFGVETRCIVGDLGLPEFARKLEPALAGLEIGLVVYNAAHAPQGSFVLTDAAELSRVIDVNLRGPVELLRAFLPAMVERRRGALILMSSLAGNQGAPKLAAYAASKAFNRVLAEGLWSELRAQGIDVLACCPGAVRTPGYASSGGGEAPGTLDPRFVAETALRALGRGPVVVPGLVNKLAAWMMQRLMPRRATIALMAGNTKSLREDGAKEASG